MIVHSKVLAELFDMLAGGAISFGGLLTHGFFWVELLITAACGIFWAVQMNRSLGLYDPLFIIPLLQSSYITLGATASGLFFEEFATLHETGLHGAASWFWFSGGMLMIVYGIMLLAPPGSCASLCAPSRRARAAPVAISRTIEVQQIEIGGIGTDLAAFGDDVAAESRRHSSPSSSKVAAAKAAAVAAADAAATVAYSAASFAASSSAAAADATSTRAIAAARSLQAAFRRRRAALTAGATSTSLMLARGVRSPSRRSRDEDEDTTRLLSRANHQADDEGGHAAEVEAASRAPDRWGSPLDLAGADENQPHHHRRHRQESASAGRGAGSAGDARSEIPGEEEEEKVRARVREVGLARERSWDRNVP
jgi:hypothetical protein